MCCICLHEGDCGAERARAREGESQHECEREREREHQRESKRERECAREGESERERAGERETERQRDRETERHIPVVCHQVSAEVLDWTRSLTFDCAPCSRVPALRRITCHSIRSPSLQKCALLHHTQTGGKADRYRGSEDTQLKEK